MDKEIKTRQIQKNIKVLDKSVTGMEHLKQSYVRTKESAEQTQVQNDSNPVEYAENKVIYGADTIIHETAHQLKKQGDRITDAVREKRNVSKEIEYQNGKKKGDSIQRSQKQMRAEAQKQAVRAKDVSKQTIKTIERGEKDIKFAKETEQAIKESGKGAIKCAEKSVKTASQTSRTTIKTTQEAAKAAEKSAKVTVQTAQRAIRAAKHAEKAIEEAVKAAAKAIGNAVKAVIEATKDLIVAIGAGGWVAVLILVIVVIFGGVLVMVGGGNSSTVIPVSPEVQAYEPLIRQYATKYGIPEYVELIKAIMMQESAGRGRDPMQSSEGAFNTRYPRKPNGITDSEYSINCGVQEVKSCLESAEVKNPVDMEHIKLALQGYNFGNGYITWAKTKYGGYTAGNAAEFSDMMAKRMGWHSYGDVQYVPHVLRYYVFGRVPAGVGNQAIVQVALTQEGKGGETYWKWYGFHSRVEWCACFVSWCADQCGYIESGIVPKFSLCSDGVKWFSDRGQFRDGSYVPAAGDIIFFDWGNNGSIDHVGIVESVTDGVVNTIEGNSGDKVKRKSYQIGNMSIYGYGVLIY